MTTEAVRQGFRTGDSNYTVEQAWSEWQQFCFKWAVLQKHQQTRRGFLL